MTEEETSHEYRIVFEIGHDDFVSYKEAKRWIERFPSGQMFVRTVTTNRSDWEETS